MSNGANQPHGSRDHFSHRALVQLERGTAADDANDADILPAVRAGRPCTDGRVNDADLVLVDLIEEALDQPAPAALGVAEEDLTALAFNVDEVVSRHRDAVVDSRIMGQSTEAMSRRWIP